MATITKTIAALFFIQVINAQIDYSKVSILGNHSFKKLDSTIASGKYEKVTSVLVSKSGKLIFEKYYNGSDSLTLHNTRSATKTIATILTGIAIKNGKIASVDDYIFKYLKKETVKKNIDNRKFDIKLADLLSMSSILECNDFNSFSRGNEERMYTIENWTDFFVNLPVRSYPFEPIPENQPYGRAFSYCSAGAAATGRILEIAIGEKLDFYLKEQLLDPLEISSYEFDYSPMGTLNTAGGSRYRSRDFLKLIQLCLNHGSWNEQQIFQKDWIKKATSPKAKVQENLDYGYFFWLKMYGNKRKFESYYMSGNGGQRILAIPELDLAVVITTRNYGIRNAHNYSDEIINNFIIPEILSSFVHNN